MLGYTAVVAIVYVGVQFAAIVCIGVVKLLLHPRADLQEWARHLDSNGFVLSISLCVSAMVTVPAVRLLTGTIEDRPWFFLGLRRVPGRAVLLSCGAIVAFIVIANVAGALIDHPPSPFMLGIYDTARFPALLVLAVVVVAPLVEEILFRGFLFGGLRACGTPIPIAVLAVSVIFAAIHTQYDAFDTASVFVMGVLFALARARFDSILPCIAMHSLANAVGFFEVAWMRTHPG